MHLSVAQLTHLKAGLDIIIPIQPQICIAVRHNLENTHMQCYRTLMTLTLNQFKLHQTQKSKTRWRATYSPVLNM